MRVVLVLLLVILGGIIVLGRWQTNQYAITPGDATLVWPLVKIGGLTTNPHRDKIMLTDVYLTQLTEWQWLTRHFESHVQFVSEDELLEPGIPSDELEPQGYLEMSDAKLGAEVAAFRALGWRIATTGSGAVITGVVAPSPARSANLAVGDEIVAAGATPIDSTCQLVSYLHPLASGTAITLHVKRVTISPKGVLTYGATSLVKLTTGAEPTGAEATGCPGVSGQNRSWLGVSLEDGYDVVLPARVRIDTANIGGPSAGLAMTLTLINELSRGSLTGHHVIAATGTVDFSGQVGAVGGVEEKAVAVHRAGATYFLVPDSGGDVAAARDAHQPDLTILPVNSLAQALRDLRRLGGVTPTPLSPPS
jgi:PDZ domain-containing protein